MSMVLRNLHSTITEEYGLPSWMSYVLFALATIIVGALLGLVNIFPSILSYQVTDESCQNGILSR
jgi:hypothetical protein